LPQDTVPPGTLNRPGVGWRVWSSPGFVELRTWILVLLDCGRSAWEDVAIRRSSLAGCSTLVESGRAVIDVARDLGISAQSIYTWRRQARIDRSLVPGLTSAEKAQLVAAKRRIAELEIELAAHQRATELLRGDVRPKSGSTWPR
jgi:transposase